LIGVLISVVIAWFVFVITAPIKLFMLYVEHAPKCDSIYCGIIAVYYVFYATGGISPEPGGMHIVFRILLIAGAGIGAFFILSLIQGTKVGYWIFAVLVAGVWGLMAAEIGKGFYETDRIWYIAVFAFFALTNLGIHFKYFFSEF